MTVGVVVGDGVEVTVGVGTGVEVSGIGVAVEMTVGSAVAVGGTGVGAGSSAHAARKMSPPINMTRIRTPLPNEYPCLDASVLAHGRSILSPVSRRLFAVVKHAERNVGPLTASLATAVCYTFHNASQHSTPGLL